MGIQIVEEKGENYEWQIHRRRIADSNSNSILQF